MIDLENPQNLTKKEILSAELIDNIYDIQDEVKRQVKIIEIEEQAKLLGAKTKFEKLIKAQEKIIDEQRAEIARQVKETNDNISYDFKPNFLPEEEQQKYNTGKWLVDDYGIKYLWGESWIVVSPYPIIITDRYIDHESKIEKLKLVWIREIGNPESRLVERGVMLSSSKITELSNYGFPVNSESSKALVRYLADFEGLNDKLINKHISVSKFGWINDDFMPFCEDNVVFDNSIGNVLTKAVKSNGDYGKWLEIVKQIRKSGRIEPLIYLAASFGSVLLPLLNVTPFMVNIYGGSGQGKTVSMKLASSVWAEPDPYIAESTSTLNSLEQQLNVVNHLPFMIDDLSKIRDKGDSDKLSDMIYNLCAGHGKGRLTKDIKQRDPATWCNIILTNMERPLASDSMQGGAINRVIDIAIREGNIYEKPRDVVKAISNNYGHAGKDFIEIIKKIDNFKNVINEMVLKYEKEIRETAKEKKEEKQVTPLAILLATDELIEKYIFKDGVKLDLKKIIDDLKNVEDVSEMDRALERIKSEVASNRMCYVPDENGYYRQKIRGHRTDDEIIFLSGEFLKVAKENDFSPKQFLKWAKDKDLLEHETGKNTKRKSIPTVGYQQCYVFKIPIDKEPEEYPPREAQQNTTADGITLPDGMKDDNFD